MREYFKKEIKDVCGAESFLHQLMVDGLEYHPDDNPRDIINFETKERLFSDREAIYLEDRIEEARRFVDPCEVILRLQKEKDRAPEFTFVDYLEGFEVGSNCAVDFVVLKSGKVLGINDECVVLYESIQDFETASTKDRQIIEL